MNKSKQILVSGISLIAISTVGVASVNAENLSLKNMLSSEYFNSLEEHMKEEIMQKVQQKTRQKIQQIIQRVENGETIKNWNPSDFVNYYLPEIIKKIPENINQDLQQAIKKLNELNELGLPDPKIVKKSIIDIDTLLADVYDSKALVNYIERLTNQLERNITRLLTDNTLGEEGQKRIKQELETTLGQAEIASRIGEDAQNEVVTQDVIKKIAQQNNEIARILASVRNDGLQLQQSQDLTNLNLTNISRAIDGQNQARATEIVSQGFANYRTAAKATLSFSHENNSSKNKNEQQKQ